MLTDIKTILYATDLGKNTRPAFRMAVSLAKQYNARILFLFVVEPLNKHNYLNFYLSDEDLLSHHKKSVDEVHQRIEERIAKFCEEEMNGEDFPTGGPQVHI